MTKRQIKFAKSQISSFTVRACTFRGWINICFIGSPIMAQTSAAVVSMITSAKRLMANRYWLHRSSAIYPMKKSYSSIWLSNLLNTCVPKINLYPHDIWQQNNGLSFFSSSRYFNVLFLDCWLTLFAPNNLAQIFLKGVFWNDDGGIPHRTIFAYRV